MTARTNPTHFTGLICEDVRQEVGNKLTFVGVIPGGIVNIPPSAPQAIVLALSFVFIFADGDGEFSAQFRLIGPGGQIGTPLTSPAVKKIPDEPMVSAFQFKPLPPLTRGAYKAQVELAGQTYDLPFLIRDEPTRH